MGGGVIIGSPVVNYKIAIGKEKAIALHHPWVAPQLIPFFFRELRKVIDELDRVGGVGHAEPKLELVLSNQLPLKVVSFNHDQVVDGLV